MMHSSRLFHAIMRKNAKADGEKSRESLLSFAFSTQALFKRQENETVQRSPM